MIRHPVYDVVRELPPSLRALAHRGAKSYGESFDLIHRREATKSNSIWQADHAQLDIKLLKEDGSVARPWLTIVIDDYSRAIAGSGLQKSPAELFVVTGLGNQKRQCE